MKKYISLILCICMVLLMLPLFSACSPNYAEKLLGLWEKASGKFSYGNVISSVFTYGENDPCFLEFKPDKYVHITGYCYNQGMFGSNNDHYVDEDHVYLLEGNQLTLEVDTEKFKFTIEFQGDELIIKSQDSIATFKKYAPDQNAEAPAIEEEKLLELLQYRDPHKYYYYPVTEYTLLSSEQMIGDPSWQQVYRVKCAVTRGYNQREVTGTKMIKYYSSSKEWYASGDFELENITSYWDVQGTWIDKEASDISDFRVTLTPNGDNGFKADYFLRMYDIEKEGSCIIENNPEDSVLVSENLEDTYKLHICILDKGVYFEGAIGYEKELTRISEDPTAEVVEEVPTAMPMAEQIQEPTTEPFEETVSEPVAEEVLPGELDAIEITHAEYDASKGAVPGFGISATQFKKKMKQIYNASDSWKSMDSFPYKNLSDFPLLPNMDFTSKEFFEYFGSEEANYKYDLDSKIFERIQRDESFSNYGSNVIIYRIREFADIVPDILFQNSVEIWSTDGYYISYSITGYSSDEKGKLTGVDLTIYVKNHEVLDADYELLDFVYPNCPLIDFRYTE